MMRPGRKSKAGGGTLLCVWGADRLVNEVEAQLRLQVDRCRHRQKSTHPHPNPRPPPANLPPTHPWSRPARSPHPAPPRSHRCPQTPTAARPALSRTRAAAGSGAPGRTPRRTWRPGGWHRRQSCGLFFCGGAGGGGEGAVTQAHANAPAHTRHTNTNTAPSPVDLCGVLAAEGAAAVRAPAAIGVDDDWRVTGDGERTCGRARSALGP
jgi:hypothetical protein